MSSRREANRRLVTDFYTTAFIEGRHAEACARYVGERYIQHNPFVPDGVDGFLRFFEAEAAEERPDYRQRILRVIADEDYAAVHATIHERADDPGTVLVDLFRIEDGRIVEHWDAYRPLSAEPERIPHGNGETETIATGTRSDHVANRRSLILFYDRAFVMKDYAGAADEFFGDRYIQHNAFVGDGAEAFKRHFQEPRHERSSYCEMPLRYVVDDDHGVVQVWLRPDLNDPSARGIVLYDIFRFDEGRIVEHWDVGMRIPDPAAMPHANGVL